MEFNRELKDIQRDIHRFRIKFDSHKLTEF
jgi:hypothetical protein